MGKLRALTKFRIKSGFTVQNRDFTIKKKILTEAGSHLKGKFIIPEGVKAIGDNAFGDCSKITCVEIPAGVTQIGEYAFSWCTELTEIELPDSVTEIKSYAFFNCKKLEKIQIPASVTRIGKDAFTGCDSLNEAMLCAKTKKEHGSFPENVKITVK